MAEKSTKSKNKKEDQIGQPFQWAVPKELEVPPDPLKLRLDFYNHAVRLYLFDGDVCATKHVSAMDVAQALSRELPSTSGLLPKNTLWWANTSEGAILALWEEPKVYKLALLEEAMKSPRRFECPMPGLVFLCTQGKTPWVFAMKRRPTKLSDLVYKAPLCNIFSSGRVCPGTHKFPVDVGKIPDSFFRSFFSPTADLRDRSEMFPESVVHLWEFLDKKKKYPMNDLVKMGTVKDLLNLDVRDR